MISATDLKNGKTFSLEGVPYKVAKYTHQKIGRGGANVKVSARNLKTGVLEEKTFNSTLKVEEIATSKKSMQYLYSDSSTATFIDPTSYEQVGVAKSIIESEITFIKEGETVDLLFWEDKVLSIDIAPKISLQVKDTAPGVKGNSATNIYKPATLENGLTLKVPLFIKVGDKIRVDTRTAEYVERVNN